jgi:hypothetical protein
MNPASSSARRLEGRDTMNSEQSPLVLMTGASGYVGGRLLARLEQLISADSATSPRSSPRTCAAATRSAACCAHRASR